VKFWVILVAVMLSADAHAIGYSLPAIEDLPIIRLDDPRYANACVAFQKALFIQTGISSSYNTLRGYIMGQVDAVSNQMVREGDHIMRTYSPVDPNSIYALAGFGYTVFVQKQITKSFRNPIVPIMSHSVTLSMDAVSTGISISF
jgi:hypothetical protein